MAQTVPVSFKGAKSPFLIPSCSERLPQSLPSLAWLLPTLILVHCFSLAGVSVDLPKYTATRVSLPVNEWKLGQRPQGEEGRECWPHSWLQCLGPVC